MVLLFCSQAFNRTAQDGAGSAELGGQFVSRSDQVHLELIDIVRRGAKGRRRNADGADDGTGVIANGGAKADDAEPKFFTVDRKTSSTRQPQLFFQRLDVRNGLRRK